MKCENILILIIAITVFSGCSSSDTPPEIQNQVSIPQIQQAPAEHLMFTVPEEWTPEQPASRMRFAQYSLPGIDGMASAELAVFSGIGGTTEENIQRWYTQFAQPNGGSVGENAEIENMTVNDIPVTVIYFTGTFLKSRAPMMMSGPVDELHGYALLAAIAETPSGAWHFKATGPEKTINAWRDDFNEFVQSFYYMQ